MKLMKDLLMIAGLVLLAYVLSGFKRGPAETTGQKVGHKVDQASRFAEQEFNRAT